MFEGVDELQSTAVIDTGCQTSLISADLIYIFLSDKERLDAKAEWMNCRNHRFSSGVESANKRIANEYRVDNPRVVIENKFSNIRINGVKIENDSLYVSYDTTRIALIGIGIIKYWDMHIGKDIKTNKITLLACPYNQLNDEYFEALENTFGISSNIQSSFIRNKLNKGDKQ
jgi:hypothetical protein